MVEKLKAPTGSLAFPKQTRPVRKRELVYRILDEECILYDDKGDKVYTLNATAAFVWKLCDGKHTVGRIIRKTAKAFGGADAAMVEQDVRELLGELNSLQLLTLQYPLKLK